MRPGDPLRDNRQGAIAVTLVLEAVFMDEDSMCVSAPLAHQGRTGLQHDTGMNGQSAFR